MEQPQVETTRSGLGANTGILRFPELQRYHSLVALMTGRRAPALAGEREFNMHPETGEDCAYAYRHRELLAREVGIDVEDTVWFDPDDPGPVRWVSAEELGSGATDWSTRLRGASGLVAQCTNLMLAVPCNDNVTILLHDPRLFSIGLAVIDKNAPTGDPVLQAIHLMVERGDADRKEIIAFFAPSLGPCCYTFPDPSMPSGHHRTNLWDVARTALLNGGLLRNKILHPRICTACRDSEFFTRTVDGAETGAGAVILGVMDADGSLAETLERRKNQAVARRAAEPAATPDGDVSLSLEEARLNKAIRCPYGQNKVYIRSELATLSTRVQKPEIALRCEVMAQTGFAADGYNIVNKDWILQYCAGQFEACEIYQAYELKRRR